MKPRQHAGFFWLLSVWKWPKVDPGITILSVRYQKNMFQNKEQKVTIEMVRQKSIWIQTTGLQLGRALPDI